MYVSSSRVYLFIYFIFFFETCFFRYTETLINDFHHHQPFFIIIIFVCFFPVENVILIEKFYFKWIETNQFCKKLPFPNT